MLNLLDESLEEFLRTVVPLPRQEIDVSFDKPDREWAARVAKPTVNLYLWDVRRNTAEREYGGKPLTGKDNRAALARVNCRYLVTAWTSDIRDEHSLLGLALTAILRYPELGRQYLRGGYASVTPLPRLRLGEGNGPDSADFWSAIGGTLKPGLDLVVTATVDSALPGDGPA